MDSLREDRTLVEFVGHLYPFDVRVEPLFGFVLVVLAFLLVCFSVVMGSTSWR